MKRDFPDDLLAHTAHRQWPVPDTPWLMTQSWHDLLFAHWPLDPAVLRDKVPTALDVDLFDGRAWLAVVPFHMTNVAPRGLLWLGLASAFPELNVRTYVTAGGKPGVYFFSLDAASGLAVVTARTLFHLPYHRATMTVHVGQGRVSYRSTRTSVHAGAAELAVSYGPVGPVHAAAPGTLEHFLTERYCLYTKDRRGRLRRLEIHHRPWPLQTADAQIAVNTMAAAAGIDLPGEAPLLHFAKRMDVLTWGLTKTLSSNRTRQDSDCAEVLRSVRPPEGFRAIGRAHLSNVYNTAASPFWAIFSS